MRLETDNAFFFDFFLAEHLHLTLEQVRALPAREWLEWNVYFGKKAQQKQLDGMRRR